MMQLRMSVILTGQMEKYAHRRNVILEIIDLKAHYNIVKTRPC